MMIGIIGSRRRNLPKDRSKLYLYLSRVGDITKIITGDCDRGGDKFAREYAKQYSIDLEVKHIIDPDNGEEMDFKNHRWFSYNRICNIFYKRDREIVKEPLDCLLALVAPDRTGGTEYTITQFKKYHKDWEEKLIIL